MTRARTLCLLTSLIAGCASPPAQAREGAPQVKEADQLFTSGKYDAALQKYDAMQKSAPDERSYTRALFRAVECETLLSRHEQALDRVRAAKLPADAGLRAIVELGRIETFRGVQGWYGFSEEAEEGAQGSAKLSKAAADKEMEDAAQVLWRDREKLARVRLADYSEFFVLKDVDFPRYPSLWDFAVLRLAGWLGEHKGRTEAVAFTSEDFSRKFDAGQPTLTRLAALYEESGHLSGGGVDRAIAQERWRVARVMLGAQAGGTGKQMIAFHEAAIARLLGWTRSFSTPLGRADAAAKASSEMFGGKRRVEALMLIDDVLPKTPESDVAVELRQLKHQILMQEISISTRTTRDGKKALKVTTRNLRTLHLRLYRMDPLRDSGDQFVSSTMTSPRYDRVEGWVSGRKPAVEWKISTGDKGDHMPVELEIDAPAPGVGLYLVAAANDASFTPRKSIMRAAFANVTDLAIARAETGEGLRYYAFDVDQKAPASGVKFDLQVSQDWRTRSTSETRTGSDGVASYPFPNAPYVQIDALAQRGQAVALFPSPTYHGRRTPEPPLVLYIATDRPIYRPGQTAKVRLTSIERVRDGSYKIDAHRKLHLVLQDPNGKEVARKDLVTGAMGSVAVDIPLPQKGLLGQHTLYATAPGLSNVSAGHPVRVEEYKRPEFEVTLEAPKAAAKYGEKTKLTGNVKYYFGGAASEVPVHFKVSRQRWIPWWYYWRNGSSPKVEIARGDLKTDKQGGFTAEFVAAPDPDTLPSEDPDVPDVSDFVVEVEAHDAGGRTISADRTMRVGSVSLLVAAEADRGFFLSDEKPLLRVKATNLEEQPIAGDVSWELEKLGAPKEKPAEGQPLQAVLKKYPTAEHLQKGTVKLDGTRPAELALPPLAAGGYRLRLTSGGAKGSFAFLVADAKTRALSLVLPPIALTRTNEAQPGDKVDLLVGASAASGAYHVELWRSHTLIEHRVDRGAPVRVWTIPVGAREAGGFTARWIGVDGVDAVGSDVDVRVPRKDKNLTVKLVGKPDALEPGQGAKWSVEVRDQKGRPVEGEALVTIYDRSLELYAKSAFSWATALWGAPPSPSQRTDGVMTGWGVSLPEDEAAAQKVQKEILGRYKSLQLPRFSWEQTRRYRGNGYFALGGAPGAPAEEAETTTAMPMKKARMARGDAGLADNTHEEKNSEKDEDKEVGGEGKAGKKAPTPPGDLRTNMAETAAFVPDVKLGADGRGSFGFTAPERLTSWRVQILALGRAVEAGTGEDTFATKKPLMVRVEIPRFFREGDRSTIVAVVHNETNAPVSATVELDVVGADDNKNALDMLGVKEKSRRVEVPAHGLAPVEFAIVAPETIATYKIRAHAQAGKLSDAEERPLPVLPSRERLVQSRVVALKGNDNQVIKFEELLHSDDPSLRSESMTVSIDPQLALAVLRSIPFLVEYPYECVEQTLNRYVPLAIVNEIYKKHPALAKAIAAAPHRETQHEPWLSDDPRRMLQLTETPWLVESQGGSRDSRLRDLLNPTLVTSMGEGALDKLRRAQLGSGGFPWFPGGRDDFYMTLYVLEQLSMLQEFGLEPPRDLIQRALAYVGRELPQHLKKDEVNVSFLAYGAYVITSFETKAYPEAQRLRPLVQKWMDYVLENKQVLTPYGRAWCARTMARLGDKKTAMELLESALDGSKTDPVVGVYWTPERYSWMWYSDSVEKHAFFLRTLAELKPDDKRVPGMLQWLLFNRKGNQWHSTKASAAAVYSILDLMQKQGSLSKPEKFRVQWAKQDEYVTVRPDEDRRAPLMWTAKGREVTPAHGEVKLGKEGPGIAFASATWIFSSTKLQGAHPSNLVSIDRKYFVKVHRADGDHLVPLASGDKVKVGDQIEVRLYVKTKSQFEYVHVKEPRGAGFEETTLTSGWTWDRLPAYQEPRDSLFNFFVSWLPHGEYELHHSLRPTTPGKYRIGSAVLQSMYSPDITAYSAGMELEVVK